MGKVWERCEKGVRKVWERVTTVPLFLDQARALHPHLGRNPHLGREAGVLPEEGDDVVYDHVRVTLKL